MKLSIVLLMLCLQRFSNGIHLYEITDDNKTIGKLLERLDEKDRVINILPHKLDSLESFKVAVVKTIAELTAKVEQLTATNEKQEKRITENEAKIEELAKTVRGQSVYINDLESFIELRQNFYVNQDRKDDAGFVTENNANVLANEMSTAGSIQQGAPSIEKRQHAQQPVAFFATLNVTLTHLGANQPILFDRVLTNTGDAYQSHVGAFVAPVTGLYVFTTTLMSNVGHTNHFQYSKNGIPVSNMPVSGGGSSPVMDSTSQTIVLYLAKADEISVRNYEMNEDLFGDNHSTFAGFLLQEIFDGHSVIGK